MSYSRSSKSAFWDYETMRQRFREGILPNRSPLDQGTKASHKRPASIQASRPYNDAVKEQPIPNKSQFRSKCTYYLGSHTMMACSSFSALDLHQRLRRARELELCQCCLKPGHLSMKCVWRGCPNCEFAKHCRLLCPKGLVRKTNNASIQNTSRKSWGNRTKKD